MSSVLKWGVPNVCRPCYQFDWLVFPRHPIAIVIFSVSLLFLSIHRRKATRGLHGARSRPPPPPPFSTSTARSRQHGTRGGKRWGGCDMDDGEAAPRSGPRCGKFCCGILLSRGAFRLVLCVARRTAETEQTTQKNVEGEPDSERQSERGGVLLYV